MFTKFWKISHLLESSKQPKSHIFRIQQKKSPKQKWQQPAEQRAIKHEKDVLKSVRPSQVDWGPVASRTTPNQCGPIERAKALESCAIDHCLETAPRAVTSKLSGPEFVGKKREWSKILWEKNAEKKLSWFKDFWNAWLPGNFGRYVARLEADVLETMNF
jgi:hypothetical protein